MIVVSYAELNVISAKGCIAKCLFYSVCLFYYKHGVEHDVCIIPSFFCNFFIFAALRLIVKMLFRKYVVSRV